MTPELLMPALRDIHLPASVPPGPTYSELLIAVIVLALLFLSAFLLLRQRHRHRTRRAALRRLNRAVANFQTDHDTRLLAEEISAIFRFMATSTDDAPDIAGLCGERWLRHLDSSIGGTAFSRGPGRILLSAPYLPAPGFNPEPLIRLCRKWIISQPTPCRRK